MFFFCTYIYILIHVNTYIYNPEKTINEKDCRAKDKVRKSIFFRKISFLNQSIDCGKKNAEKNAIYLIVQVKLKNYL